jgi:hypothetical protein
MLPWVSRMTPEPSPLEVVISTTDGRVCRTVALKVACSPRAVLEAAVDDAEGTGEIAVLCGDWGDDFEVSLPQALRPATAVKATTTTLAAALVKVTQGSLTGKMTTAVSAAKHLQRQVEEVYRLLPLAGRGILATWLQDDEACCRW